MRALVRDVEPVPLTAKAFDILVVLVRNHGRTVDKAELMREVWPETVVHENNLAQQIALLRRVLGDVPRGGRYIATVSGSGYQFVAPVARATERKLTVLGVLPLRSAEPTSDGDYLGLWLVDALVTRLRAVRGVHVQPVASVMERVSPYDDPVAAGRRLGVDVVLGGSVEREDSRVRVEVALVDVGSGSQLWSGTFEQPLTDIFVLQDALTDGIARALAPDLSAAEGLALRKSRTTDADAYRLYLSGRFLLDKRTTYGLEKSLEYFERAIAADPGFAAAYVGIADALAVLAFFQTSDVAPIRLYERSLAAAERALDLDPDLAEAHATVGLMKLDLVWDWEASRRSFTRALELDPRYATAYFWYGRYLLLMGDTAGAEAALRRAVDLEPVNPSLTLGLAGLYLLLRRYDEALDLLAHARELETENAWSVLLRGRALEQLGRREEAAECFRLALAKSPDSPSAVSAMAHADASRADRAAAMARAEGRGYSEDLVAGLVHARLGELDAALDRLERALGSRTLSVFDFVYDPRLDPVRETERYTALVRTLGLPYTSTTAR